MASTSGGIALADEIEEAIAAAFPEPGSLFATEDQLRPRHGTGRSTVRQAARILEQRGVAYMKRGVGGGLIVMEPDPEPVGRMLAIVIGSRLGNFFDMLRLVKATDATVLPSGIGGLDLAECDGIRAMADKMEAMAADEFSQERAHWHLLRRALGALGNPATLLAYHTWMECNADLIPFSMNVSETRRRGEYWALTLQAIEALVAGDISSLFEFRNRQIRFAVDWHAWRGMESHRPLTPSLNSPNLVDVTAGRHGADRLSRELLHEIRLRRWEPDAHLGGFSELMERYGVSSAMLRQATRMLEECSTVYTKPGRGGGVFIGDCSPEVPIRRATNYLKQARVPAEDIRTFLTQILLECLSQIPDRATSHRIEQVRDGFALAARQKPGIIAPELVMAIGQASGNAALSIWVEVLMKALPQQRRRHIPDIDLNPCFDALAESIAAYDTGRARRALIQLTRSADLVGMA